MTWKEIMLGQIAEFRNGLNYTKENEGTGLLMINVKDFGDRFVPDYSSLGEISAVGVNDDSFLQNGDILFVRSNGNRDLVGRSLLVEDPPANLSFSAFCIRARLSIEVEAKFYAYFFRSSEFRKRLSLLGSGTNISNLNQKVLSQISVPIPERSIQRQIIEVLSPYDYLIENNKRRIALLEESVRLLYKEWFVDLRFPGHEHVKIIDGVPIGWRRVFVPEIIEINPAERVEKGKEIRYVPMSSLSETGMTINLREVENRDKPTSGKFRNGDTLFARITPCLENGKTAYVNFLQQEEVACGSTEFIVLRGIRVSSYFVYCLARTYDFREHAIKSMIGSSGRQRVQISCFNEFQLVLPPNPLLEQFNEVARNCFESLANLQRQNDILIEARDLLLPRLMKGEIQL
ncbi:restriction endonuclease subunit S [Brevibacillus brevis]|uniref:restriction endonuclease subunit S n=1 Tax=Brevibacillus brevis TaxID=1393 RepID=UPI001EDBA402|nr:restriction endonuclease subunit S [Brevibacillus brevis]UKL00596.1 restriction endonuclease subunit S [Brevibacillus brevis]